MSQIKIFDQYFTIEEIRPSVNRNMLKRPTKHTYRSLYRDYPHTTINGKGLIARLKNKSNIL